MINNKGKGKWKSTIKKQTNRIRGRLMTLNCFSTVLKFHGDKDDCCCWLPAALDTAFSFFKGISICYLFCNWHCPDYYFLQLKFLNYCNCILLWSKMHENSTVAVFFLSKLINKFNYRGNNWFN